MTYREKLQQEHPKAITSFVAAGCFGCPKFYGYGPECVGNVWCKTHESCTDCWDREIPEKEVKVVTYRVRLQREHPERIADCAMGGCIGCPKDYGYGPEDAGNSWCRMHHGVNNACTKCWDGVIPEIEEVTDMNYTNAAVRQLIMAAFFNAVGSDIDSIRSLDYIRGVSAMADAMIELMQQDEDGADA